MNVELELELDGKEAPLGADGGLPPTLVVVPAPSSQRHFPCTGLCGAWGKGQPGPPVPGTLARVSEVSGHAIPHTRGPGPAGPFQGRKRHLPAAAFRGRDGERHTAPLRAGLDPHCPAGAGQSKPGPWLFVTLVRKARHTRPKGGATPGCASDVSLRLQACPPPGTHEPLRAHTGPTFDP